MKQNKVVQFVARGVVAVGNFVSKYAKPLCVAVGTVSAVVVQASTDATSIATDAQTAFGVIAPITITIAGFYVILHIAKRVVH